MKIIERATMPNGTEIQLEDWSDKNTERFPDLYGLTIGAYPIAKNTGKYRLVRSGESFRIHISQNKYTDYYNDDVQADFEALKSGEKTLEDSVTHIERVGLTVRELNRDQLNQLKESLAALENDANGDGISLNELLESHDRITDEEVYEYFDGMLFSEGDFYI